MSADAVEVLVAKIDPQTGWLDPSVIPPSAGGSGTGGGGVGGGGPQSLTYFYPGVLAAQLGVAAFRAPTSGAVLVQTNIQGDFSEFGRVVYDVKVGGFTAYRMDTNNSPSRQATLNIAVGAGGTVTLDIVAAAGSGSAQPKDVTIQVWWRYP